MCQNGRSSGCRARASEISSHEKVSCAHENLSRARGRGSRDRANPLARPHQPPRAGARGHVTRLATWSDLATWSIGPSYTSRITNTTYEKSNFMKKKSKNEKELSNFYTRYRRSCYAPFAALRQRRKPSRLCQRRFAPPVPFAPEISAHAMCMPCACRVACFAFTQMPSVRSSIHSLEMDSPL